MRRGCSLPRLTKTNVGVKEGESQHHLTHGWPAGLRKRAHIGALQIRDKQSQDPKQLQLVQNLET